MDIDFGDLDGPSKPPPVSKPTKFAPKNSKFKPLPKQPKLEQQQPVVAPKLEIVDDHPLQPPDDGVDVVDNGVKDMEVDNGQKEGDEDEVVREIDVYFNSSVDSDSKLYVLQYPLRPSWRPYELEERCEQVRVKPKTSEVEVEMSVQVDSENYDDVDGDKALPKQVLSSAWQPQTATAYAVGILTRNELHLNPVHTVVQLRPSMKHLQALSKKSNTARDEEEQAIKQNSKKQSKLPGAVNEQNIEAKEKWISLEYHGETSRLSRGYMGNMVAQQASQIQFSMSPSEYIDSFCPATADKLKPKGPSRSSLLKLPLEERLKIQLLEGPPVQRFKALKHIAPDHSDSDIFKVLQTHATLVQGLWVVKTNLKYAGITDNKKPIARNYVLLQFSRSPIFHELQFSKSLVINEIMKGILGEFAARRDSCRDWKFKEHPDNLFIKEYPEIVLEQKNRWDAAEPELMRMLFPKTSKLGISDKPPVSGSSTAPKTTKVTPSRTVMLDDNREALLKAALQKLLQTYKVLSWKQIPQKLQNMAVSENTHPKGSRDAKAASAAATAAEAKDDDLMKILSEVAVDIHGSYVLRPPPNPTDYDRLRNVVINLFIAEGPGGKLKKASIFEAAYLELKREITTAEYQKVLNELCVSKNSAWVLKSGDTPI
ncbi:SIN-like family protein [Artemisia annua]|uniref:SIN-like family protein n=1 Tax=Artemisia annua TaxID=35608 RepID=A0A2U1PET8_ARTAN|nr:SIN-like family protein [Artemisia annua]